MYSTTILKQGKKVGEKVLHNTAKRYIGINAGIRFFKRAGQISESITNKIRTKPIMAGTKPMIKQTPGRAQFYYTEGLHLIPDNILYQVRMPNTLAGSEPSKKYNDVVDKEIIKYLQMKLPHNLFDPEKGHTLDLTVKQVRQMLRASEQAFQTAASGELNQTLKSFHDAEAKILQSRDAIDAQLDAVSDKVREFARETKSLYAASAIEKSGSVFDLVPCCGRSKARVVMEDVGRALELDPNNKEAKGLAERLHHITKAKLAIAQIKLDLVNYWTEFYGTEHYDKVCFEEAHRDLEKIRTKAASLKTSFDAQSSPFHKDLSKLKDELLPLYWEQLKVHENVKSKKDSFYASFINEDDLDLHPDKFKDDLLAYLSGAIVLKDHRYRYQHEQYDRYLTFKKWVPVVDSMTLRTFSNLYAKSLRTQVDVSHNFLCPQVDANYDDYGKKTVNPISSTVFYLFFSAHRARRHFAQIILSAARYPNEKIRRAYLRFFSNA